MFCGKRNKHEIFKNDLETIFDVLCLGVRIIKLVFEYGFTFRICLRLLNLPSPFEFALIIH
jgi:hypothetical protein